MIPDLHFCREITGPLPKAKVEPVAGFTGMSTVTSPASVDRELAAIVGESNVKRTDFEINGVVPAAVVYPGSADEIGAILHLANARDLVVAPAGGLTKQQIGCVPERIDIHGEHHALK